MQKAMKKLALPALLMSAVEGVAPRRYVAKRPSMLPHIVRLSQPKEHPQRFVEMYYDNTRYNGAALREIRKTHR